MVIFMDLSERVQVENSLMHDMQRFHLKTMANIDKGVIEVYFQFNKSMQEFDIFK